MIAVENFLQRLDDVFGIERNSLGIALLLAVFCAFRHFVVGCHFPLLDKPGLPLLPHGANGVTAFVCKIFSLRAFQVGMDDAVCDQDLRRGFGMSVSAYSVV